MVSRYQGIPKFYYLRVDDHGKEIRRPLVPKVHDGDETAQGFHKVGFYARDKQQPIEYIIMQSDDPKVVPTPPGLGWELDEANTDKKIGHYVFERPLDLSDAFASFEKFRIDEQWPVKEKMRTTPREPVGDRKPNLKAVM